MTATEARKLRDANISKMIFDQIVLAATSGSSSLLVRNKWEDCTLIRMRDIFEQNDYKVEIGWDRGHDSYIIIDW